jgi:hypothetical protein
VAELLLRILPRVLVGMRRAPPSFYAVAQTAERKSFEGTIAHQFRCDFGVHFAMISKDATNRSMNALFPKSRRLFVREARAFTSGPLRHHDLV